MKSDVKPMDFTLKIFTSMRWCEMDALLQLSLF